MEAEIAVLMQIFIVELLVKKKITNFAIGRPLKLSFTELPCWNGVLSYRKRIFYT